MTRKSRAWAEVPDERRRTMSAVKGTDTKPEMVVRRMLHRLGYRYRLHCRDLPGSPDLVFPGRRKAIEVRGCFWHRHPDPSCKGARAPKSHRDYWEPKLAANVARDTRNEMLLAERGWALLVVWEYETASSDALRSRLTDFLGPSGKVYPARGSLG